MTHAMNLSVMHPTPLCIFTFCKVPVYILTERQIGMQPDILNYISMQVSVSLSLYIYTKYTFIHILTECVCVCVCI